MSKELKNSNEALINFTGDYSTAYTISWLKFMEILDRKNKPNRLPAKYDKQPLTYEDCYNSIN